MGKRNQSKEAALSLDALRAALSYDPQTGLFTRLTDHFLYPAGTVGGHVLPMGYRMIRACGARFLAHRLAWFYTYGVWPTEIDHINRRKDDNRLSNLRVVTRSENMANSASRVGSELGIKHISRKKNNFDVRIMRDRQMIYRKSFPCLGLAVKARNAAIMQSQTYLGG